MTFFARTRVYARKQQLLTAHQSISGAESNWESEQRSVVPILESTPMSRRRRKQSKGRKHEDWALRVYMVGMRRVGDKNNSFSAETLQIAIFRHFIVLPPYPLPKTYDEWVRREG
jgi:hypothetical protein